VIVIAGILNTAVPILIFILILGVVVLVHELGHFLMARRAGIFVEEFAMGMGPKLFTFKGKKKAAVEVEEQENVTLYTIRALPIGGFCKMRGMEENVTDDPEAFNNKGLFSRILVIAGGSIMNFVLAIVLFSALIFMVGYNSSVVDFVVPGMPAEQSGLMQGDRVTHINGSRVRLWDNFMFMLETSGGQEMDVRVVRNGEAMHLAITPVRTVDDTFRIGMSPVRRVGAMTPIPEGFTDYQRATIIGSVGMSFETIGYYIRMPIRLLGRFLTREPMPDGAGVQSIIGIGAQVTEVYQEAVRHGILPVVFTMINITALISVALGTTNLFPIPALDGARLVFLFIEGIRRKPISREREGMVHFVGFVVLIVLLVVVAYRDITNLL